MLRPILPATLSLLCLWTPDGAQAAPSLTEAYRLLNAGKVVEALAKFEAVIAAKPRTLEAYEGVAWAQVKLGNPVLAARAADQRLRLRPNDAKWRRKWIEIIALVPARRVEAILGLRQIAQEEPDNYDVKLRVGVLLDADGRSAEALPHLEAVVAARPKDAEAREALVWTLVHCKLLERAAKEADARVALEGPSGPWRIKWADVIANLPERRKEAIATYRVAVAASPGDIDRRLRLGQLLFDNGAHAEALPAFEAVVAARPKDAVAREGLVWTLVALGRHDDAAREADAVMALRPSDAAWQDKRLEILVQSERRRPEALAAIRAKLEAAPGDLTLRMRFAQLSLAAGNHQEALPHFEFVAGRDPQNSAARAGLAFCYLRSDQCDNAAREADAVLALRPGDADWRAQRWEILSHCPARRAEALAGFRLLYLEKPNDLKARLRLAALLLETGEAREAANHYRVVLTADPRNLAAREGLAWALLKLGLADEAMREAEIRTQVDGSEQWRERWLEMLSSVPSHRPYAIAGLEKVVKNKPALVAPRLRLAELLLESKRADEAHRHFLEILKAEPTNLRAREGVVWSLVALGQFERATFEADARLALKADDPEWREKRLEILSRVPERRSEAISGLRALVAAAPQRLDLRQKLATLFLDAGNPRDALPHFETIVQRQPENRAALEGLAWTYTGVGRRADAVRLLDQLIARDPRDVKALLGRAQLARWAADYRKARELLQRALDAAPNDLALKVELARVELGAGNRTLARDLLADARKSAPERADVKEASATLRRETELQVGIRPHFSDESTPIRRISLALPVQFFPLPDTRLGFDIDVTRFTADADSMERFSIGFDVRQALPAGFHLRAAYHARINSQIGTMHDARAEAGVKLLEGRFELRAGVRNRALWDNPIDYEDVASFREIGSGGTTMAGLRDKLQIAEGYLAISAAPWSYLYFYLGADYGQISDENRRASVSFGTGLDFLGLFGVYPRHNLRLRYDLFYVAFQKDRARYFSPSGFSVHMPNLEWRHRPNEWAVMGAEVGLPMRSGAVGGNLVGVFAGLRLAERVILEVRLRNVDDTKFRTTAVTAYVAGTF